MKKSRKVEYHFAGVFRERVVAPTAETFKLYGKYHLATFHPKTTQELQMVVKYANDHKLLVVQSAISSKVFPSQDFLLLDFSHMNKIEWDKQEQFVSLGMGVNLKELLFSAKSHDVFFPCLSSPLEDLNMAHVIHNFSMSHINSFLYGAFSSFVIGFEGVLGSGEIITIPAHGYSESAEIAKNLFFDRFGRHGILTHLILKTLPAPAVKGMFCIEVRNLKVGFRLMENFQKMALSILECYFFDKQSLDLLSEYKGISLTKDGTAYVLLLELFSTSLEELSRLMNRIQILLADVLEDVVFIEHTQLEDEINKKHAWKNQVELSVARESYDFRKEYFFLPPSKIPIFMEDCEKIKQDFGIDFLFSGSLEHGFLSVYILNTEDEGGFIWSTFQHEIRAKLLDVLFVHGGSPIFYSWREQGTLEKFFMGESIVSMSHHLQNWCDPQRVLFSLDGGVS